MSKEVIALFAQGYLAKPNNKAAECYFREGTSHISNQQSAQRFLTQFMAELIRLNEEHKLTCEHPDQCKYENFISLAETLCEDLTRNHMSNDGINIILNGGGNIFYQTSIIQKSPFGKIAIEGNNSYKPESKSFWEKISGLVKIALGLFK